MLIIPVENRPDWRNPPLATLLLIAINVLVFFLYQGKDTERLEQAAKWYGESTLVERERLPFYRYLQRSEPELFAEFDTNIHAESADPEQVQWQYDGQFHYAVHDKDFVRELHQQLGNDPEWRDDRSRLDAMTATLSARAYAFNAADARPITWLTSMFLHGSASHLFGNMVFLFLVGFALEIAIGRGIFLLLYLCSGLGGTLLYWASVAGADSTVLGASGAVSGLMGMYIALYGMRKISFFYHVIFFVGQFRAPALIILPVWIGFELWGAHFATDNVAYWAHTGGLLFGFVLLALWMRVGLKVDRNYVEKVDHDAPLKAGLARVQQLMVAMKFDAARQAAEALVQVHPRDARAWRGWYGVVKIAPASREFHTVVHSLFKNAAQGARDPALQDFIEEVAHEYMRIGGEAPALTESASLALAQRLGRVEHIAPLAFVVKRLIQLESSNEAMPRLLQAASVVASRAGKLEEAQLFRDQLQRRFPQSPEARQLVAHAAV